MAEISLTSEARRREDDGWEVQQMRGGYDFSPTLLHCFQRSKSMATSLSSIDALISASSVSAIHGCSNYTSLSSHDHFLSSHPTVFLLSSFF